MASPGPMDAAISAPRDEVSVFAPRIVTMQIKPDKVRDIIGPGGKTIRAIQEQTGAQIDINDRLGDLWQEARLVIWRAKHKKAGVRTWDPHLQKDVQSFVADDRLVLMAVDTTKGVLDSIIKLRREAGHEGTGIPRWAIERIERALRNYPEAQHALLKELAAENETYAEKVED